MEQLKTACAGPVRFPSVQSALEGLAVADGSRPFVEGSADDSPLHALYAYRCILKAEAYLSDAQMLVAYTRNASANQSLKDCRPDRAKVDIFAQVNEQYAQQPGCMQRVSHSLGITHDRSKKSYEPFEAKLSQSI